jgi:hypothetical protein
MTNSSSESDEGKNDLGVAALFERMITRDQQMWQQLTQRDNVLQDQLMELFSRMIETNAVDRVLSHGFGEVSEQLSAQLAPLRQLGPQITPLEPADDQRLAALGNALRRQDYTRPSPEDAIPMLDPNDFRGNRGKVVS